MQQFFFNIGDLRTDHVKKNNFVIKSKLQYGQIKYSGIVVWGKYFQMAIQDMTHEPVDKIKDGKIHVLEYALLSLIITPLSLIVLIDRIQIKIGLDH